MTTEIAIFAATAALAALTILAYRMRGTREKSEADINAWKLRLEHDLQ